MWNSDMTVDFVKEYQKHPCLWDVDHTDYKNKTVRYAALNSMVKNLGVDGFNVVDVRKKIRIIRSTYWNECTKVLRSKKLGATPYKPKLAWFELADQFLKKVTNCWENQTFFDLENSQQKDEISVSPGVNNEEVTIAPNIQANSLLTSVSSDPSRDATSTIHLKKRKLKEYPSHYPVKAIHNYSSFGHQENEFDIFGKSISAQLKQLPLKDAIELQIEMQSMIGQRRLKIICQENNEYKGASSWRSGETSPVLMIPTTILEPNVEYQCCVNQDKSDSD